MSATPQRAQKRVAGEAEEEREAHNSAQSGARGGAAARPSSRRRAMVAEDPPRCAQLTVLVIVTVVITGWRPYSREFVPPAPAPLAPKAENSHAKRWAHRSKISAANRTRRATWRANRTRRARRPRIPVAPNRTAPTPPTHHCQNVSLLACNVSCARCGASPRPGGVGVDLNCCHGGGAWEGLCGGAGSFFSYRQGYRACNLARILRAGRQRPPRRAAAANRSLTRPRGRRGVMTFDRRQLIL